MVVKKKSLALSNIDTISIFSKLHKKIIFINIPDKACFNRMYYSLRLRQNPPFAEIETERSLCARLLLERQLETDSMPTGQMLLHQRHRRSANQHGDRNWQCRIAELLHKRLAKVLIYKMRVNETINVTNKLLFINLQKCNQYINGICNIIIKVLRN